MKVTITQLGDDVYVVTAHGEPVFFAASPYDAAQKANDILSNISSTDVFTNNTQQSGLGLTPYVKPTT